MIKIEDITTGEVAGRGLFDELMRTSKAHLQEEYDAGRIVGADYGVGYLSMLSANLQAATSFVLQYQLTNKQLEIADEQRKQVAKQTLLIDDQIAQIRSQVALSDHELASMRPLQMSQLTRQNTLLDTQNSGQLAQTALVNTQKLGQDAQNLVIGKQEDLIDKQILSEEVNTTTPTAGLAKVTYDKGQAEISLLGQKLTTETAQTSGDSSSLGGLVKSEILLKEEQRNSFIRDAEQKAAKFYADVLSITYSTNPDAEANDPIEWGLGSTNAKLVMDKLREGISVS